MTGYWYFDADQPTNVVSLGGWEDMFGMFGWWTGYFGKCWMVRRF